jgi:hypothetical protein
MESSNTSSMSESFTPETEKVCPECGAPMAEFDRLAEEGALFIWYACTRENCTGQWLAKKVLGKGTPP